MAQPRSYNQISQEERDAIAALYAQRVSLSEIARQLRRNKSSISREISRNKTPIRRLYGACRAHDKSKERKIQAGHRPRLKNALIRNYVKKHLRMEWTPEQIAGRLRIKYPEHSICVESIYRFIYDPGVRRQENFVAVLPRAHRIRNYRGQRKTHRKLKIPERISILERPGAVQQRKQAGQVRERGRRACLQRCAGGRWWQRRQVDIGTRSSGISSQWRSHGLGRRRRCLDGRDRSLPRLC